MTFKTNTNYRIRLMILSAITAIIFIFNQNTYAQLDETWTITVNGQTVQVNPNGSFRIPNISAADQFGLGGPGTIPDFLSDDFLRAIAIRTFNGITQYAFSEPFQIKNGETFIMGDLTFTNFPPPFPQSIGITVNPAVLTAIDQTTQLTVTGNLTNKTTEDITQRAKWTIYRTSNPEIATVGEDGLVTAKGSGVAFITAINEGATAVVKITVVPGDPLTIVEGFVQFEDGTAVVGADVNIQPVDLSASTGVDGSFQVANVPTQSGTISVRATKPTLDEFFVGSKQRTTFVPGGITDAGITTLKKFIGTGTFGEPRTFLVDSFPEAVISGDFNGDSLPDIATANSNSSNVSILIGDGTGNFSAPTNFPVGNGPYSIISADFNRDNLLDLATTNFQDNSVTILVGDGAGSFSNPTNFPVDDTPLSIVVDDFNGDSVLDIATANNRGRNMTILIGDGTGNFPTLTNFPVGSDPHSIISGDFNGDNLLDIATVNNRGASVSILIGDGDGNFSTPAHFSVGNDPGSITTGDFNGDNLLDLATANGGSANVSILINDGAGNFSASTNFSVDNGPRSIVAGDFNGDNLLDLATANSSTTTMSILIGDGTGNFSVPANIPVGGVPRAITVGDFNGDNVLDLTTANAANNSVAILLALTTESK